MKCIVLVVAVLALLACVDAKAAVRMRALARARDFNEHSVDPQFGPTLGLINADLANVANTAIAERTFYVTWAGKLPAEAVQRLALAANSLNDANAAGPLSDANLEDAAKFLYQGRHTLRLAVRGHQTARGGCAAFWVWVARLRDWWTYGNANGPTFQWVAEHASRATGKAVAANAPLPREVSLHIIFSAVRTNARVNAALNVNQGRFPAVATPASPTAPAPPSGAKDLSTAPDLEKLTSDPEALKAAGPKPEYNQCDRSDGDAFKLQMGGDEAFVAQYIESTIIPKDAKPAAATKTTKFKSKRVNQINPK